jgi:anti-sigma factor RsiW
MKHPKEEELIAYHDGEAAGREGISTHVADCPECRAELDRIDALLAAIENIPVPEPGEDYGQRVWQQISPRLPEKRKHWWDFFLSQPKPFNWLEPRRWVAAGVVAALVLAAFIAGRLTKPSISPVVPASTDQAKVRERILLMAVGEHLGRSEMVLVELANAGPQSPSQKQVNISGEQRRAEDLLEENRLYRQTALEEGDSALASVLDELERVLLDVAHSPQEVTPTQLENIRQRVEARGILFKVRVVGKELQERGESGNVPAQPNSSGKSERNKV